MLEQLEQPKRKRGDRSETDTPSLQIMRKMTIERSEQLKKEIMEMQQTFKQLKSDVETIKAGQWDDRLQQEWESIKAEQKVKDEADAIKVEVTDDAEQEEIKIAGTEGPASTNTPTDTNDTTQDSVGENMDISVVIDEESNQPATTVIASNSSSTTTNSSLNVTNKLPGSMLSSLLKSEVKSATGLQQLKNEQEHGHQQISTPVTASCQRSLLKTPITQDDVLTTPPSSSAPTLSRLLSTAKIQGQSSSITTFSTLGGDLADAIHQQSSSKLSSQGTAVDTAQKSDSLGTEKESHGSMQKTEKAIEEEENVSGNLIKSEAVDEEFKSKEAVITTEKIVDNVAIEEEVKDCPSELDVEGVENVKEETDKDSQDEDSEVSLKPSGETVASEAELTEALVKDEPLSPTSSVSSRISETGSKRGSRNKGRPRGSRLSKVSIRKSNTDDERKDDGGSSKHSDGELSEDEVRETEDILTGVPLPGNASSILSESFPNSPASLSICSDTEEEKSFKQWKKSIMLVWRAAATHKYANVFLHPVTDDIAPGYKSVVLRPMDLSTIKKNVETGIIRSTVEFQRDMMLMFSNAIMYNSSDHNVYRMAQEMYDDVMQHIEQYVNTQIMVQSSDSKNLRQSRRPDASDKEDESKKRRLSVDHSEGGKTKKRKTRLDESLP